MCLDSLGFRQFVHAAAADNFALEIYDVLCIAAKYTGGFIFLQDNLRTVNIDF